MYGLLFWSDGKKRRIGVVDVNDNIINKNKVTLIIPTTNKRYFINYFTMYREKVSVVSNGLKLGGGIRGVGTG